MGPDQTTPPVMFVETTGLADPSVFLSVLADPSLGAERCVEKIDSLNFDDISTFTISFL
jgi:G3E family GTPase